jgi:hypothetical protein
MLSQRPVRLLAWRARGVAQQDAKRSLLREHLHDKGKLRRRFLRSLQLVQKSTQIVVQMPILGLASIAWRYAGITWSTNASTT